MKLFPTEPDFVPGAKGFRDKDVSSQPYDLLQRAETGKQLSDLLERIDQPLVIALDGEWGSGKSHFLRLWAGAHRLENGGKARVVYFDAFEHDFLDDPLISLVGVISDAIAGQGKSGSRLETLRKWGAKLAKPAARITIAAATGGASELAAAIADPIIAATGKELTSLAENFWQNEDGRRAAMAEFRKALSALTSELGGQAQKLIIVVDELDRCRPDFALSLLEVIKHFFTVPHVHFVLGANMIALTDSVRTRYGQGCDAERYLQKFVHVTMRLPTKFSGAGVDVRFAYFDEVVKSVALPPRVTDALEDHLKFVVQSNGLSLRDVERVVAQTLLVPELEKFAPNYRHIILTAILARVGAPDLYRQLRAGKAVAKSLLSFYGIPVDEQDNESGFETYMRVFWRSALHGEGTDQSFKHLLLDYYGGDRRDYIEQFLRNRLDTFGLASPG